MFIFIRGRLDAFDWLVALFPRGLEPGGFERLLCGLKPAPFTPAIRAGPRTRGVRRDFVSLYAGFAVVMI
jgi:hypothetical protein